jgi:hypothetical protein
VTSDRHIVAAQAPPARLERLVLLDSWPGLVPVLSLWLAPPPKSSVWALFPSGLSPPLLIFPEKTTYSLKIQDALVAFLISLLCAGESDAAGFSAARSDWFSYLYPIRQLDVIASRGSGLESTGVCVAGLSKDRVHAARDSRLLSFAAKTPPGLAPSAHPQRTPVSSHSDGKLRLVIIDQAHLHPDRLRTSLFFSLFIVLVSRLFVSGTELLFYTPARNLRKGQETGLGDVGTPRHVLQHGRPRARHSAALCDAATAAAAYGWPVHGDCHGSGAGSSCCCRCRCDRCVERAEW